MSYVKPGDSIIPAEKFQSDRYCLNLSSSLNLCIFTLHVEINIQQSVLISANISAGRSDVSSGPTDIHGYVVTYTPVNLGSTRAHQSQGSCCVLFI